MQRKFAVPARPAPADPLPGVVIYGLGAIGLEVVRALAGRTDLRLAGVVDVDPAKVGRDVGELLGDDRLGGVRVSADLAAALAAAPAKAVIHTTGSFMPDVYPQLEQLVQARLPVVSSTEELAYPYLQHPELARELDRRARELGVPVIGLGVNPGFVMDALPALLGSVCRAVETVRVRRVVDAARRRGNLQRKIGAGMTAEQFQAAVDTGRFGHVGLVESAALLAEGLGWRLDEIRETLEPVVAATAIATGFVEVAAGQVAGIHQTAVGVVGGRERILLDLTMQVGHPAPFDAVSISGDPPLELRLEGGVAGDAATVGRLLNAVTPLLSARPGLLTVLDLPIRGVCFAN